MSHLCVCLFVLQISPFLVFDVIRAVSYGVRIIQGVFKSKGLFVLSHITKYYTLHIQSRFGDGEA